MGRRNRDTVEISFAFSNGKKTKRTKTHGLPPFPRPNRPQRWPSPSPWQASSSGRVLEKVRARQRVEISLGSRRRGRKGKGEEARRLTLVLVLIRNRKLRLGLGDQLGFSRLDRSCFRRRMHELRSGRIRRRGGKGGRGATTHHRPSPRRKREQKP